MIRTNYAEDLAKYVKNADKAKLNTIIKACGIALKGLDSQYVSITDDAEVARVANGFGAKKLGLSAAATKSGLAKVAAIMKADRTKLRTTVYYLLAQATGTLAKLAAAPAKKAVKKKAAKKVKKAAKKPAKKKAAKKKAKKGKK